jgi:hypothetical protein
MYPQHNNKKVKRKWVNIIKVRKSKGWEHGSAVEYLPSMCKTLGFIPNIAKIKNKQIKVK